MLALILPLALAQTPAPAEPDRFARWEKAVRAIEARLKAAPPKEGGTFFAGASSIVRWDLAKSFPDAGHVNVGFGGSAIADSTHFAGRILVPFRPARVVFYAGDNDIAAGGTAERVAEDFRAFAAAVHAALPKCRVYFVAVKPSVLRRKKFAVQARANEMVKAECGKDARLTFVDVVPDMLGADGEARPELLAADGLHLSPAGYAIWTAKVKAALAE